MPSCLQDYGSEVVYPWLFLYAPVDGRSLQNVCFCRACFVLGVTVLVILCPLPLSTRHSNGGTETGSASCPPITPFFTVTLVTTLQFNLTQAFACLPRC